MSLLVVPTRTALHSRPLPLGHAGSSGSSARSTHRLSAHTKRRILQRAVPMGWFSCFHESEFAGLFVCLFLRLAALAIVINRLSAHQGTLPAPPEPYRDQPSTLPTLQYSPPGPPHAPPPASALPHQTELQRGAMRCGQPLAHLYIKAVAVPQCAESFDGLLQQLRRRKRPQRQRQRAS